MFKLADGRKHLYQWDMDIKLLAIDEEPIDEIHFCINPSDRPYRAEIKRSDDLVYVIIPNTLLRQNNPIYAMPFCKTDNGIYTKYKQKFEIIPRSKPEDYIDPDDEEDIRIWGKLEKEIEALKNKFENLDIDVPDEQILQAIEEYISENPIKGEDGIGIHSIKTTTSTEDGGNNVITITLTNGQTIHFTVKNGSTGAKGSDANVTPENIKNALGYTPADEEDVTELNEKLVQETGTLSRNKVNKPSQGNGTAGQALLTNGDGTTYWGFVSGESGSGSGEYETLTVDIRKGKYWGVSYGKLASNSAITRDSTSLLYYDREVIVTPTPPAKIAYFIVEDDLQTVILDSGWKTESIKIPANTHFVLNFNYRDQDLTDIDTLSWYTFKIETSGKTVITTDDITNDFGYDETKVMSQKAITEMFSQITAIPLLNAINNSMRLGTQWSASIGDVTKQINTVAFRGCCDYYICAPYHIEMIANAGFKFALVYLDDDNVVVGDIGWQTQYTIPANQRFVFSLERTNQEAFTEEIILQAVVINPIIINENDISQSLYIEYGRLDGATYNFVRIPKVSNDGAIIKPVVALTSTNGDLNGGKCSPLTYSKKNNLQFTINAGLFDVSAMIPVGQTIIDGVSVTNTPMVDDNGVPISDTECYPLCIDADGNLSAPYDRNIDTATMISDGVKYAITGWGKLVDNFEITQSEIDAEIVHNKKNYSRQCIGQFENGDYCVLTTWAGAYDTNYQNEAGMTYEECAQIMVNHGVKFAYSLDGGGSAATVIKRRQINPIYQGTSGRSVPSVIYFTTE